MIATLPPHACPPTCRECRLRKTGAFTAVKPEVLNFIEGFRTDSLAVAAGGALVRENQTNAKLFTLYSGWAFRYKTMSDGRRQIDAFHLPGDFFGIEGGSRHHFSADAIDSTTVIAYRRSMLDSLSADDGGFAGQIVQAMIQSLERARTHMLLLGRKTYDSFYGAWPDRDGPMADKINTMRKVGPEEIPVRPKRKFRVVF